MSVWCFWCFPSILVSKLTPHPCVCVCFVHLSFFLSLAQNPTTVPWPLLSWDIGMDPNDNAGNQFHPRVFKSHLRMASVYRGCKYIVTVRDPGKTALSFYNFFLAKQVPLALDMDASTFLTTTPFLQGRPGRASLWEYYQEYHALKDCPSVLVLVYEDLVKDMKSGIAMIAQFMGLPPADITPALIDKVASMSTKKFMAAHMALFDEPYEHAKQLGRAADLSQLAPAPKIAVQTHPQTLNDEAQAFLRQQWDATLKPLGYDDYAAFCNEFRTINQQRYASVL